jgi:hypothetical protein
VRLDTVRKFALSLPETTEEPHFEKSSFRVKGKIFVTIPEDNRHLHVHVDPDEGRALIASQPTVFEEIVWGKRVVPGFVRINLDVAERGQVFELVEEAWRMKAPKRVLAAFDAARAG